MKESVYTADQVAKALDLHPKTVRRFIREGKLKARKVGGQWRVTDRELKRFSGTENGDDDQGSILPVEHAKRDRAEDSKDREKVRVSSVVDVYVDDINESIRLANTLMAVMNSKGPEYGQSRYDHIYYKEEGKARFILWGRPLFISKMLHIIHEITK